MRTLPFLLSSSHPHVRSHFLSASPLGTISPLSSVNPSLTCQDFKMVLWLSVLVCTTACTLLDYKCLFFPPTDYKFYEGRAWVFFHFCVILAPIIVPSLQMFSISTLTQTTIISYLYNNS